MLATFGAVAFEMRNPEESDPLQGISRSFFASLERDGGGAIPAVLACVLVAVGVAVVVWLRKEARRLESEQRLLDAQHGAAVAAAAMHTERRAWVRVPAHLAMTVMHVDPQGRVRYQPFETQNISAGGLAFLSDKPPAKGAALELTLDLGERAALQLRGTVVRIEVAEASRAPALVALRLDVVPDAARERLMKWIAAEEVRELTEARKGRLCARCRRPLADTADVMHSTCASAPG